MGGGGDLTITVMAIHEVRALMTAAPSLCEPVKRVHGEAVKQMKHQVRPSSWGGGEGAPVLHRAALGRMLGFHTS